MTVKKHKCLVPVFALWICFVMPIASQANDEKIVARFTTPSDEVLAEFTRPGYDVAAFKPGEFLDIVVTRTEFDALISRGFQARIVETETRLKNNLQVKMRADLPGYRTYQTVVNELQTIVATYPAICRLYDIGDSQGKIYAEAGGRAYSDYRHDIWALKVSDNPETREDEPAVLYIGAHHAREPISVEVAMAVLYHILQNYGTDPAITWNVDNTEIWFVPILNPDGHRIVTRQIDVWWRKNLRDNDGDLTICSNDGVDLNRNYGFRWGNVGASDTWRDQTYHGPHAWSEPETAAMRRLTEFGHFVTCIMYHSYGEDILYPFSYQTGISAPDIGALSELSSTMAAGIPGEDGGVYGSMPAWRYYPHMGTGNDWMYGVAGAFTYTVELATQFIPPAAQIPTICNANIPAAMTLLDRVNHSTLTGQVTDAHTGEPVVASMFVDKIDSAGEYRHPYKSSVLFGRYYRMLLPGYYTVTFSAHGYDSEIFENVRIDSTSQTVLNAALTPDPIDPQCAGAPILAPTPAPGLSPTLTWETVSGASNYKIRIYDRLPKGAPILENFTGGLASFTPHCPLPKGDYFWMVSSDLDYSCYSAHSHFSLSPELREAVAILRFLAGRDSVMISDLSDVDGDGKIGVGEAICILQAVAGTR